MSIAATKLALARAKQLADNLVADLGDACEQLAIVGSVRRRKPEVGDIELLAVPKFTEDLFGGAGESLLDAFLSRMVEKSLLVAIKGGDKYKQFSIPLCCKLDVFVTTPDRWGLAMAVRTGPANFSQHLVTYRKHGGYLPAHLAVRDGFAVWQGDKQLPTATEKELFELFGMKWKEPWERG